MTNDGCTKGRFKMISVNDISCHTTQINKREAQQLHQKRTFSPKSDDDNQKATKERVATMKAAPKSEGKSKPKPRTQREP